MDDVLTTQEVADYLGVHRETVYRLIKWDGLPASRIPTLSERDKCCHYRVLRTLLDRWIDRKGNYDIPKR